MWWCSCSDDVSTAVLFVYGAATAELPYLIFIKGGDKWKTTFIMLFLVLMKFIIGKCVILMFDTIFIAYCQLIFNIRHKNVDNFNISTRNPYIITIRITSQKLQMSIQNL